MTVRNNLNNYATGVEEDSYKKIVSSDDDSGTPKHSVSDQSHSDFSEVTDSVSEDDAETFEGLLKICGEANRWQFQVSNNLVTFCISFQIQ